MDQPISITNYVNFYIIYCIDKSPPENSQVFDLFSTNITGTVYRKIITSLDMLKNLGDQRENFLEGIKNKSGVNVLVLKGYGFQKEDSQSEVNYIGFPALKAVPLREVLFHLFEFYGYLRIDCLVIWCSYSGGKQIEESLGKIYKRHCYTHKMLVMYYDCIVSFKLFEKTMHYIEENILRDEFYLMFQTQLARDVNDGEEIQGINPSFFVYPRSFSEDSNRLLKNPSKFDLLIKSPLGKPQKVSFYGELKSDPDRNRKSNDNRHFLRANIPDLNTLEKAGRMELDKVFKLATEHCFVNSLKHYIATNEKTKEQILELNANQLNERTKSIYLGQKEIVEIKNSFFQTMRKAVDELEKEISLPENPSQEALTAHGDCLNQITLKTNQHFNLKIIPDLGERITKQNKRNKEANMLLPPPDEKKGREKAKDSKKTRKFKLIKKKKP